MHSPWCIGDTSAIRSCYQFASRFLRVSVVRYEGPAPIDTTALDDHETLKTVLEYVRQPELEE